MGAVIDVHDHSPSRRARIALILGDPSGVGPELIAKLLSNPENHKKADMVVLCDRYFWLSHLF